MSNPDSNERPTLNEGGNTGLIFVIVLIVGLLVAGIVYSAFFKVPPSH